MSSTKDMLSIKKHCQMVFDDGIVECGYLVGGYCKSDRDHPVRINKWVHDALKVVGCASWSKYLEWNNGRREDEVPELPVKQMGDCRCSPTFPGSIERRDPVPMHVLQEGGTGERGHPTIKDASGRDLMDCDICGKKSVVKESDGHNYCDDHHRLWCKCWSHQRMLLAYKEEEK